MDDATPASLPDDPQTLKSMIASLMQQRDDWQQKHAEVHRKVQNLEVEKLRLEVELLRLKKWYYGRKADALTHPADSAQLVLSFARQLESLPPATLDDVEAINDENKPVDLREVELSSVRKLRRGRRNLAAFDQLPTVRKEYDLPEEEKTCPCCQNRRKKIGEEISWQIEYIPGRFERIEHVRFKYACAHCEENARKPQITLADKASAPIDKGLPGPGLLSFVVTSKFADFLPLYRLEDLFARSGFEIGRATMSVWCRDVADLLKPLYERMVQRVLCSHLICTDDTTLPMLSPGNGKTRQAKMWVYVGDKNHPYDVFDFTLSRSRDGPNEFLRDFRQTILADAYGGYDGIVVSNDMKRAGCWAHARRKFVDAEKAHPAIAQEAVELIGKLYGIERRAKDLSSEDRAEQRRKQSQPILERFHQRLSDWKIQLLPKHPMAEAVNYCLRQWKELNVFAGDGAVPIDNNISEREMKRIVLTRKNSLFVGSPQGGHTAAVLCSFTSTCRRHDINPQRYLTQLLTSLPDTPMSQLDQWLPDQWRAIHADQPEFNGGV